MVDNAQDFFISQPSSFSHLARSKMKGGRNYAAACLIAAGHVDEDRCDSLLLGFLK